MPRFFSTKRQLGPIHAACAIRKKVELAKAELDVEPDQKAFEMATHFTPSLTLASTPEITDRLVMLMEFHPLVRHMLWHTSLPWCEPAASVYDVQLAWQIHQSLKTSSPFYSKGA